jgi:hypothetical protein
VNVAVAISPTAGCGARLARLVAARLKGDDRVTVDSALVLAHLEARRTSIARIRDEEVPVVSHHGGPLHLHVKETEVPRPYHFGIWVEGTYQGRGAQATGPHAGHAAHGGAEGGERFVRVLSTSVGLSAKRRTPDKKSRTSRAPRR